MEEECWVFFIEREGGHRDPHTCPTRRSSDLGDLGPAHRAHRAPVGGAGVERLPARPPLRSDRSEHRPRGCAGVCRRPGGRRACPRGPTPARPVRRGLDRRCGIPRADRTSVRALGHPQDPDRGSAGGASGERCPGPSPGAASCRCGALRAGRIGHLCGVSPASPRHGHGAAGERRPVSGGPAARGTRASCGRGVRGRLPGSGTAQRVAGTRYGDRGT